MLNNVIVSVFRKKEIIKTEQAKYIQPHDRFITYTKVPS